ncbi:MAG: 2-methylcitrate dehydratase [Alphaproteobacteria bacterium]|jgi:2-methylcitrate dehydratase
MDATTEKLVDYAMGVRFEDISAETVAATKHRILDTLGCVAGGYDHPMAVTARTLANRYTMDTPATVLGAKGAKAAPEMAAFANGVMLRLMDLSDTYRVQSGGHPSDIIAAVLAAAEIGVRDGKSLIAAVATGYEIYCSCCDGADLNILGWDQPVYGVVASALAAGQLMGLDREQMGHAVAFALVPNMAMFQTRQGELSNWKGAAGGNASRNGVFAAILAQSGLTGPPAVIEGKYGLWDQSVKFDWPLEVGKPPYRIANTDLKCFPVCYHGQSAVWAAIDMRDDFNVDDIESVGVDTYGVAKRMMANAPSRWAPNTHESADHSMPYVVAAAFLDGAIDMESFSDTRLHDPKMIALMNRVTVEEADDLTAQYPEAAASRITVRLKNGTETSRETLYPKGHHLAQMSAAEIESKFKGLFSGYRSEAQADQVIDLVANLDAMDDIETLFAAFA